MRAVPLPLAGSRGFKNQQIGRKFDQPVRVYRSEIQIHNPAVLLELRIDPEDRGRRDSLISAGAAERRAPRNIGPFFDIDAFNRRLREHRNQTRQSPEPENHAVY